MTPYPPPPGPRNQPDARPGDASGPDAPPNPYAPPAAPAAPVYHYDPRAAPVHPYTPAHGAAIVAMVLLGVTAVITAVSVAAWWHQYGLVSDVAAGKAVASSRLQASDTWRLYLEGGTVLLQLFTAIPFCIWFYVKHRNLPGLGSGGLLYTPGWAAGAFFVPILNLFRPYQIGAEIWNASNPHTPPYDPWQWRIQAGAPLVGLWWAFYLAPSIVDRLVSQNLLQSKDPATFRLGIVVSLCVDLAVITAALITIQLIRRIQQRQEKKFARLSQHVAQPPPPAAWPPPPAAY